VDRKRGFKHGGTDQIFFSSFEGRTGVPGGVCAVSFGKRTPEFKVFAAD
jgi:hypothetical protein